MNSRRIIICIIIHRPSGKKIADEMIARCFAQNGDGWGLMYENTGVIHTAMGMDLSGLKEAYAIVPADVDVALHFRWKTHGDIGLSNNHPYPVLSQKTHGKELWLMHNGVITIPEVDKTASDTRHWIELKVRPVLGTNPELLAMPEFRHMLEDGISGSRILFLDELGTWTFLNERSWKKQDGCVYSTNPPSTKPYVVVGQRNWQVPYADTLGRSTPLPTPRKKVALLASQSAYHSFVEESSKQRAGQYVLDDDEEDRYDTDATLVQSIEEVEQDLEEEAYENWIENVEIDVAFLAKANINDIEYLVDTRAADVAVFLYNHFAPPRVAS